MINKKGENIDTFVIENQSLYHYLINKYCQEDPNIEDIREFGFMSYILACQNYDTVKSASFSAYLNKTIINLRSRYYKSNEYKNKLTFSTDQNIKNGEQDEISLTGIDSAMYESNKFNTFNSYLIKDAINFVKDNYSEIENKIFNYHLLGYSQDEEAKILYIPQIRVSRTIRKIQKDLRNEFI